MSDAELSRELALALGWKYVYPHSIETDVAWFRIKRDYIAVSEGPGPRGTMLRWRKFDYRDPTVWGPLLDWLGSEYRKFFWYCSPTSLAGPRWSCSGGGIIAPTLAEAVARAVIAVKKG